jgi:hypothetical protein
MISMDHESKQRTNDVAAHSTSGRASSGEGGREREGGGGINEELTRPVQKFVWLYLMRSSS